MSKAAFVQCPEGVETPGKGWWDWPQCGWFLAQPWEETYSTQEGTQYAWGGVCKRHGEVKDGT